jgi:glucuronoarabinoxylan endo-1,4-beta-xylanase
MNHSITSRVAGRGLRLAVLSAGFAAAASVSVDIGTKYQTIRGYGSSSAWNSGSFSGSKASNATILWADDTLDGHAGLTMLRTRIDPGGSFASEADPMTQAKKTNPNILIWSTEWSPPAKYKDNNNVNGKGDNNTFNNTAANSQGYADYLVNYVKTIKTTYGVDLWAVSPQNEPDWNTTYESCIWTGAKFLDFVKNYMGPSFKAAGLTTKILLGESLNDNLTLVTPTMTDATAKAFVSVIGGHLYGAGPNTLPSSFGTDVEHWETEYSWGSGTNPDNSMSASTGGLQMGSLVHKCMVKANMTAYHHWWTVWTDNTGLINGTTPSKKLFVLGNYSKFVRPGYVRISATETPASGVSVSAYYSSKDNRVVVVAINSNNSTVSQAFAVGTKFPVLKVTPWVTDPSHDLARQTPISQTDGSFTYTLSAQSVTSFVINGTTTALAPNASVDAPLLKVEQRDGAAWLHLPSSESGVLRVVSQDGRELESRPFPAGSSTIRLGARNEGVYLVEVKQGANSSTAKFVQP